MTSFVPKDFDAPAGSRSMLAGARFAMRRCSVAGSMAAYGPTGFSVCRQGLELGKTVANHVPRRLRTDEDVSGGGDRRRIDQGAESDVHIGAVPHQRVEQRAAFAAAGMIPVAAFAE
jgi:hypothetical protein